MIKQNGIKSAKLKMIRYNIKRITLFIERLEVKLFKLLQDEARQKDASK
jgi:hypothetical protein